MLLLFLALPLLGLVVRALAANALATAILAPLALESLRLSLISTALVVLLVVALGTPLALLLAHSRIRFAGAIETLVDLPLVLPPAVAGLALLLTFGRRGLLGGALDMVGIELPFTTAAVVLAQFFVAAPFYVRSARTGFVGIPREVEEAAMSEGASSWQVFRYVTVPLAAPSLLAGGILCGARALGEFGATILFAGNIQGTTQTMPLAIYSALESNLDAAMALSLLLLIVSCVLLLAFRRWLGESNTRVL